MTVKTNRLLLILILLTTFILSSPVFAQKKKRPPAPVKIATAMMMKIAPVIEVAGTVISRDDAQLAAEVPGRIIWMAEVGQYIKKGEAAAQIDDKRLLLQKREAKSKVAAAQALTDFLSKETKRLKQMAKKQHTSQTVMEKTLSDYNISLAELEFARAQLALIVDDIEKSRIIAPFNGYVTVRHKTIGEHAKVAEEIVHLVGLENIEIEASAPLRYVRYVQKDAVLLVKDRSQKTTARVSSLLSLGSGQSRQFVMRLTFIQDGEKQDWIPGMAVRVSVPTEEKVSRLVIPRDAMVIRRDGIYVFRVKADDSVERLLVTPGAAVEDKISISGDIKEGDKVVIRGNERLRPGQKVNVIKP